MTKSPMKRILVLALVILAVMAGAVYFTSKAIEWGGIVPILFSVLWILAVIASIITVMVSLYRMGSGVTKEETKGLRISAAVIGMIAGIIIAVIIPGQADKEHDYIVNGIRVSNGVEDLAGRLAVLAGVAFVVFFLVFGAGRYIIQLKTLNKRSAIVAALCVACVVLAIITGIVAGRYLALLRKKAPDPVTEADFLKNPSAVEEGSIVEFGSYRQNGSEKEPIQWRVLQKEDDTLLLMSEYALDHSSYGPFPGERTYADSDVRRFLCHYFLDNGTFTDEEKKRLIPIPVGDGNEDLVSVLTDEQAKKRLGKRTSCPATENLAHSDVIIGKWGDVGFYLRPDDPDDTTIYYYSTSKYDTQHLILTSTTYGESEYGVRPVILLSC